MKSHTNFSTQLYVQFHAIFSQWVFRCHTQRFQSSAGTITLSPTQSIQWFGDTKLERKLNGFYWVANEKCGWRVRFNYEALFIGYEKACWNGWGFYPHSLCGQCGFTEDSGYNPNNDYEYEDVDITSIQEPFRSRIRLQK